MKLVYRGSVKDIYEQGPDLVFKYSNRYSVFDWGEMPDEIPQKGEALGVMATLFFEYLKDLHIPSHFISQSDSNAITVRKVQVLPPLWQNSQYDYSMYQARPQQTLVPLEVIFRFVLGQGNSLEARLQKNPDYRDDLGLAEMPKPGQSFRPPLVECSTKLESSDRYLTLREIDSMNVVSGAELSQIKQQTQKVATLLEKLFGSFGVKLWDGKFEYAFGDLGADGQRDILLVDSIGPDELRLTYEGLPLSKELLRQLYSKSSWAAAVKKAKELAQARGENDWKSICENELHEKPQKLGAEQIETASLLYKSLANEVALAMGRERPFEPTANLKTWSQRCASLL